MQFYFKNRFKKHFLMNPGTNQEYTQCMYIMSGTGTRSSKASQNKHSIQRNILVPFYGNELEEKIEVIQKHQSKVTKFTEIRKKFNEGLKRDTLYQPVKAWHYYIVFNVIMQLLKNNENMDEQTKNKIKLDISIKGFLLMDIFRFFNIPEELYISIFYRDKIPQNFYRNKSSNINNGNIHIFWLDTIGNEICTIILEKIEYFLINECKKYKNNNFYVEKNMYDDTQNKDEICNTRIQYSIEIDDLIFLYRFRKKIQQIIPLFRSRRITYKQHYINLNEVIDEIKEPAINELNNDKRYSTEELTEYLEQNPFNAVNKRAVNKRAVNRRAVNKRAENKRAENRRAVNKIAVNKRAENRNAENRNAENRKKKRSRSKVPDNNSLNKKRTRNKKPNSNIKKTIKKSYINTTPNSNKNKTSKKDITIQ
jgi:hypothetical protein